MPVGVALLTFLPLVTAMVTVVFEVVGLRDFGRHYCLRVRFVHYLKLIWAFPSTRCSSPAAAIRAVWREQRGRTDWEMTEHVGVHLTPSAVTREDVPA